MSARDRRVVREGETHAAPKTSSNNTPESFIVGVGASGALLAGAAIVFVTLVGLVSFNVWPTGQALSVGGNVELNAPTAAAPAGHAAAPSVASGQLASTTAGTVSGTGGGSAGGGNNQGGNGQGGNGGKPKGGVTSPPATTTPPTDDFTSTGDTGSTPSAPGTASKDPAHPIHPVHPERPHQNISEGPNGKDDGTGDDSDDVIAGKGPLTRPTPPSSAPTHGDGSSDSGSDGGDSYGNGHGSSKHQH